MMSFADKPTGCSEKSSRHYLLAWLLFLLSSLPLSAQLCETASNGSLGELPSFEASTVKPTQQDNYKPIGLYVYPGGRIFAGQSTLKMLIEYAFDVHDFQIKGGPAWMDEDLFEVSAVPPDSSASRRLTPKFINEPPSEEQRRMLLNLLVQRFNLKFHCIPENGQVFSLLRSSKPLGLQPAKHPDFLPVVAIGGHGYGGMSGQSVTMAYLARRLSVYLDHPVVDRTALTGVYDFKLDASSEDSAAQSKNSFLDGIFQSVAQLGLQLKSGTGPIETIVIDKVSKPAAN